MCVTRKELQYDPHSGKRLHHDQAEEEPIPAGVFAKLFASTLEQMLEGELTEHLGYEPYEASGRNSGNNRNGHYGKKVRTSTGQTSIQVPRDRNGEFEPQVLARYAGNTNELEEKILAM